MQIRSNGDRQQQKPRIQVMGAPKGYSNLIFNSNWRGMSALTSSNSNPNPHTKVRSREQNIMLLRKSKKDNLFINTHGDRHSKSMEVHIEPYSTNKINVINLLSCSTTDGRKLKSNYCKKITLTNVQKYYESCVKKVKSIINSANQVECPEQKQLAAINKSDVINQNKFNRTSSGSTQLKKASSCDLKKIPDRSQGDEKSNIIQIPYISKFCKKLSENTSFRKNMNNPYSKQTSLHRNIYTSMCLRQKKQLQSRQISNTSQRPRIFRSDPRKKKEQFVLDAWQSVEIGQDDVF